jgi:DNA-binding GntR family transcriptional regulator
VKSRPAGIIVADKLRRMIIRGELAPGGIVTEAELCKAVPCTRTPLREALTQLRYEYLVLLTPGRSIQIPPLSLGKFREAFDAREAVEKGVMELVIPHINDQHLDDLRKIVTLEAQGFQTHSPYDLARLERDFHVTIATVTGNSYLMDTVSRLNAALLPFWFRSYSEGMDVDTRETTHDELIRALGRRDLLLAQQTLAQHLKQCRQLMLEVLGMGGG